MSAFDLKGHSYTLNALRLHSTDLDLIRLQLEQQIKPAAQFFAHSPVVIDLSALGEQASDFNIGDLCKLLKEFQLIPAGICESSSQHIDLDLWALSPLKGGAGTNKPEPADTANIYTPPLVVDQPIRSGQQIYAQGRDLIICAQVSAGAEVLADGNIHVYGSLRGRAMAGCKGDANARIYTQNLQAELVSINGIYDVMETLEQSKHWNASACISLNEMQLDLNHL